MRDQAGLEPGTRYRCDGCGNLTRFDIEAVEHVRRFWHVDLSGAGRVETEERLDLDVRSVTCRWCGPHAHVAVVEVPAVASEQRQVDPSGSAAPGR